MTAPNRAETARQAVLWTAVAAEARARAAALSAELEAEARTELARDGVAPTWRIPGLGTVPLALSKDRVDVVDEQAYIGWVADHHPSEVEELVRVRPVFDEHLRKQLARRGAELRDEQGRPVPGLAFVRGGQPRGISLRPDPAARQGAASAAAAFLDAMPPLSIELLP